MRKLKLVAILIAIGLDACLVDPNRYNIQYMIRNSLNTEAKIFMFKDGFITQTIIVNPQESKWFSQEGGKSNSARGSVASNIELRKNDSVKIEFSDGKFKVDYIEDYINSNSKSIFRDEYYITEYNCGNRCSQYIYTIDEQDYAEAK